MTNYAIDQNIIYDAWRGKKIDRTPALLEKKFIYDFLPSDHRLLLNSTIQKKFTDMKDIVIEDSQYKDNMIVPMIMKIIFADNRGEYATETPVPQKLIKKCDNHYVAVTLDKKGILVTRDEKLKNEIEKDENLKKCQCLEIGEALKTL